MRNRWIYRIYNGLLLVLLPFIGAWIALRWRKRFFAHAGERWNERWGRYPDERRHEFSGGSWWWVHAVSLGEIRAIESFLRKASRRNDVRIVLSVMTPEAIAYAAENRLAHQVIAAPIDLPWIVRRVFRFIRPALFVSVESEFWPNLLREARRSGAKVALINGRLSEHSFRTYRRLRPIVSALWDSVDLWAVRQEQDAARFAALGVPADRIRVTGNLKYDLPLPATRNGRAPSAETGPVLVFGSTREGEEEQLAPVIESLRRRWPGLHAIWAPRHIERIPELEALMRSRGWVVARKTTSGGAPTGSSRDLLWDSMGDLLDAYRRADIAIVGGSFVPKGGQNPIEPASLEMPVIFGPSMENFYGIAERLVKHGGARQVALDQLGECLDDLLRHPEARRAMGHQARAAVEQAQGATEATLKLLDELTHA
ncbi:MAG TPA: 3-deoxy-D-manno-octulosonic acid transferase [Elusimicrobiota bacterium]|nr:3-deoxy-D-manno-octulosonic acid transferase [Elusimicrobiota bacterium]